MKKTSEERISEFSKFGSVLGLERIKKLLSLLGDPQNDLKVIHVAGTNGKGSICRYIYEVLQAGGYKTGMFISPFIEYFNERIEFDRAYISDEDLDRYTDRVIAASEHMINEGYDKPTEFEIITAIALLYFSEKDADYAVLEVGLGGRGDATNIIEKPCVSVITSIDFDHTERLGNTLAEIATEKAGIIKLGVPVVSNVQHSEASKIISKIAYCKNAPLIDVSDLSKVKTCIKSSTIAGQCFDMYLDEKGYSDIEIQMLGKHQVENAKTAIVALEELSARHSLQLNMDNVRDGMKRAVQPGRLKVVSKDPLILMDGAHNTAGAAALVSAIRDIFETKDYCDVTNTASTAGAGGQASEACDIRIQMIVGILKDKDVAGMLDQFDKIASRYILVEVDNPRTVASCEWDSFMAGRIVNYDIEADPCKAMQEALQDHYEYDCTIVAGSLYLVGGLKKFLKNNYI